MTSVIVVGGGLAGLASACALAERGLQVTLLESRPRLGGRASSFADRETGSDIDNCQHVAMGCCTNYLHFCRTLGIDHYLSRERQLNFIDGSGRVSRFRPASWLPAPLHLLPALRELQFLDANDRRAIARGLNALAGWRETLSRITPSEGLLRDLKMSAGELDELVRARRDQTSFAEFLDGLDQTPAARDRFWHVVLVSALSETLDHIGIRHARKVFVDGFLANRHGWEVWIPSVPLDRLYGTELRDWLTERGAEIRTGCGAAGLRETEDGTINAVTLRDGTELTADQFVIAVPWHRLRDLLPPALQLKYAFVDELPSAPISSVHLWTDRPLTDLPHAVFVDHLTQWFFNRTHSGGETDAAESSYAQVVISASRDLRGVPQEEVIAKVWSELQSAFPAAREATLQHARLVTEHKAVFAPRPGTESLRPSQQTPIDNLHLAGDWTDTGWPATMEGAVRSGFLAAESVFRAIGRNVSVLQPDLPVARLSRWAFGL